MPSFAIERIEPEQLAGCGDLRLDRQRGFLETDADPDWVAISLSVLARPPRVGSRSTRTVGTVFEELRHQGVKRSGVGDDLGLEGERFALRQDRHAMVADAPEMITTSPTRALAPPMSRPAGSAPRAVVVMKTPSPLPDSTTLVSPVTIGTPPHGWPRPSRRRCVPARRVRSLLRV